MSFFEKFSSTKSYQYLDELIHSGKKEIILDYDIKLKTGRLNNEILRYSEGIEINADEIVIDGNGHTIDGNSEANLFKINGKKVIIKNLKFINNEFHSSRSAITIYNGSEIIIKDCIIENSSKSIYNGAITRIENVSAGIIKNNGSLTLLNSNIGGVDNNGILYAPDNMGDKIRNEGELFFISSKEDNPYDFDYLNDLIHSGKKEIKLENDIKLNLSNRTIIIDIDDLTIDGNGHAIDAILNSGIFQILSNNVKLKNITFKNANLAKGSAILNKGSVDIEGCNFLSNKSESGTISNEGEMKLSNSKMVFNDSSLNAGAISNEGKMDILYCEISKNSSKNYRAGGGGAIYNEGELKIKESDFFENHAADVSNHREQKRHGGAIYNDGGNIEIDDCSIKDNNALGFGGAIYNLNGNIKIIKTDICLNAGKEAIYNEEGTIEIKSSSAILHNNMAISNESGEIKVFDSSIAHNGINNSDALLINNCTISDIKGDTIRNYGTLKITNSTKLIDNEGVLIRNSGQAEIIDCEIRNNMSEYYIIYNSESLKVVGTIISWNKADGLGVIFNESSLEIERSIIENNTIVDSLQGIIHNYGSIAMMKSKVMNNANSDKLIVNGNVLKIEDTDFVKNNCELLILNGEDNVLGIYKGNFLKNITEKTLICNQGSCSIDRTSFEDNVSQNQDSSNIYNTSDLTLQKPKINLDEKTIYNEGVVLLKNSPYELINIICGLGEVETNYNEDSMVSDEANEYSEKTILSESNKSAFDFTYLDEEIHKIGGNVFDLKEDIICNGYERDFYEGGIELDIDNLVIEGNGHTIDGGGRSRIFLITGKDISLKNITFKNGALFKDGYDSLNTKGSSLLIHSKSNLVLENCKFKNNNSSALYAQNKTKIKDCEFSNNEIGIDNKGQLNINNGSFRENENAIINNNCLEISNGDFIDNGKCIDNSKMAKISKGEYNSNEQILINNGESEIKGIEIYNTKSTAIQNNGKINISYCRLGNNKDNCIKNFMSLNVSNCEFFENTHRGLGGSAIYNNEELTINNSSFSNNSAETGEGGAIYNNKNVEIRGSTFIGNRANGDLGGGALYNYRGVINLSDCEFEDNSANHGGAILDYGMPPNSLQGTFKTNCRFKNNSPNDSDYIYR